MKKIEKAAAKIINKAINIETYGWPPVCIGAMYQPVRPNIKPEKNISKMIKKTVVINKYVILLAFCIFCLFFYCYIFVLRNNINSFYCVSKSR